MALTIAGLGDVTADGEWFVTKPHDVSILGGACRFIIDGFDLSENSDDLVACIRAFCSLDRAALDDAAPEVFAYYRDVADEVEAHEEGFPSIADPGLVWDFVQLSTEPWVQRETPDGPWFVTLENECAWDAEHGLMLVFKEGRRVTRVSQYDGHLTNRHAFADDSIPEQAIYWTPSRSL